MENHKNDKALDIIRLFRIILFNRTERCDMISQIDKAPLRDLLAKNISFLLSLYGISRKELSSTLNIPYTTLCDWLNAKSYPRLDTLESMAGYFQLEIGYFFSDIQKQSDLVARLETYARSLKMNKDYSELYPDGFFSLFGCISDDSFCEPPDIPVSEDIKSL